MSKLAAGIYVDTIVVAAAGLPGSPALVVDTLELLPPAPIAGDVDGDGGIGSADALLILRSLVGLPPPADARLMPNGDANCDGTLGAVDALQVLQTDVGIRPNGSCLGRSLPTALQAKGGSRSK